MKYSLNQPDYMQSPTYFRQCSSKPLTPSCCSWRLLHQPQTQQTTETLIRKLLTFIYINISPLYLTKLHLHILNCFRFWPKHKANNHYSSNEFQPKPKTNQNITKTKNILLKIKYFRFCMVSGSGQNTLQPYWVSTRTKNNTKYCQN